MQTPSHRRALANSLALKQGLPVTQAAIDAMHAGIVAKLNATLPVRAQPDLNSTPSQRPASRALQGQHEIDAGWAGIVARLNAEAGLRMPTGRGA
jgi:uncharacterized protein (DUF736 family)